MSVRKFPQRQCIGCGEMKNKKEMLRVLRTPEGEFTLTLDMVRGEGDLYVFDYGLIWR